MADSSRFRIHVPIKHSPVITNGQTIFPKEINAGSGAKENVKTSVRGSLVIGSCLVVGVSGIAESNSNDSGRCVIVAH